MIILKTFKPTSPGFRHRIVVKTSFSCFDFKPLRFRIKKHAGKNNTGRIVVKHRGGGEKKIYKKIIFFQPKNNAFIIGTEYCAVRSAWLFQLVYTSGHIGYVLACNNKKPGAWLFFNYQTNFNAGSLLKVKYIPVGIPIFNVFSKKEFCFYARAAGTFCKVLSKNIFKSKILLLLPSGKKKKISSNWYATIGVASNIYNCEYKGGKAGSSKHKGVRPFVRGVAMNPIDHPHGGGSGKTSGGRPSVSQTGKLTKCKVKTRKKKRDIT